MDRDAHDALDPVGPGPRSAEPRFVGAPRRALVEGLAAVVEELRSGGPSRWVSLEAPSGWGKTRVARELYASLAAGQQDPAYWPPHISVDGAVDAAEVSARRKKVNPEVTHEPGSLPSYLWWGISCSSRHGVASIALAQDIGVLEAHGPYLDDAWRRLPRTGRGADDARAFALAAADEGAMHLADTVVQEALGAAVPGLGLVRWVGEWAWSKGRDRGERRTRLESTGAVTPQHDDIGDQVVAMLTRLARPELPAVLVVEDLHDADPLLVDVLSRLVSSDRAVLVVSTGWPGHLTEVPEVAAAWADLGEHLVRVSSEDGTPLPSPFPAGAGLDPLGGEDLSAILRHYYPRVDGATERLVVDRYANPLALELFCQIDRVRRRFRDRELRLTAADIDHLPATVRGLYRQHWIELPESVRHALAVATLGIPVVLEPDTGRSPLWNQDLMVEALQALELPDAAEVADSLEAASTSYAWARAVTDTLRRFSEPDQLQVAVEDQRSYLFEDEIRVVKNLLAARLAGSVAAEPDVDQREHAARLLLALEAEGFVDDPGVLASATLALLDLLRADPRELRERVRVAQTALSRLDPLSDDGLHVRRELGHAQRLLGRQADAEQTLDSLVADLGRTRPADDPDLLDARFQLFANLGTGRLGPRLEDLEQLERATAARHGEVDPRTLRTANLTTIALSERGQVHQAVTARRDLVRRAEAALGPDDEATLLLRANLAYDLREAGSREEARALTAVVLEGRSRALGPLHPDTLWSRRQVLSDVVSGGRFTEAAEAYQALCREVDDGVGPFHPEALWALDGYADMLADIGRGGEALRVRDELVRRSELGAGREGAATLRARRDRAALLAAQGRSGEARTEYDQVAGDLARVLGPHDALTLDARRAVAQLVAETEGPHAGAPEQRRVAEEAAAALGRGHWLAVRATREAAVSVATAAGPDAAVAILQQLLDGQWATATADPAAVASTVAELAFAHRSAGRHVVALALVEDEIARLTGVLGPASSPVVQLRSERALTLHLAGRSEEAVTAFLDALQDLQEARSDSDPQVLWLRTSLGDVLSESGHAGEAVLLLQQTYDAAGSGLGAAHQATLRAGTRLMWAMQRAPGTGSAAFDLGLRLAGPVRAAYGPRSPVYEALLAALANSAVGAVEGEEGGEATADRVAPVAPYLEEYVSLVEANPSSRPYDLGYARLRLGYIRLFAGDPRCVEDLVQAVPGLEQAPGGDTTELDACRRLVEIARNAYGSD
ncbi:putative ATP/GTP binding protein [Serinicoccus hydrothermalis]|uniref:Putative ATP/GTP binding protein n=1 Tax=Serinicoccus hydrothermalis TaxID=1758689 RepID=A0A1B1NFG2_9MICO|nr:tetratricopeptide repeat protein [Serinicoccus hydrothermalis]ANS80176.1 putative ATP/GTP binding protein [Serinicoccus hydrothermalis]